MVGNCKRDEHRFSSEHQRVSSKASSEVGDHLEGRGSPRGRSYENLEVELVKSFNPNRREIRVPEHRRGVKDPNTTQWQHGPIRHTSNVSKSFSVTRLNFGQGVGRGLPIGSRL